MGKNKGIPGAGEGVRLLSDISPYVRHCGDSPRPAWKIDERCLLDFLLVYIDQGSGRFIVDGVESDASEGDLFWIPPGVRHYMEGYEPLMVCPYVHFDLVYRHPVSHWDFSIPGGMTDLSEFEVLKHPPLKNKELKSLCGKINGYNNARVGALIREICQEVARAQPFFQLNTSGLILQIIGEILRGMQATPGGNEHIPLLEDAAKYMDDHCAESPPISEVAGICRLSEVHFRRLFRAHFRCSPREYLRRAKIRKARQLMSGSDWNLSEISLMTGFGSLQAFSRAFKEVVGVSADIFRRSGWPSVRVEGRRVRYPGV